MTPQSKTSQLKHRIITLLAAPALVVGSSAAITFAAAAPASAATCGAYQVGPSESVTSQGFVMATVTMWYNGCNASNRFVYGTMSWNENSNPNTDISFDMKVGVEDENGHFPYVLTDFPGSNSVTGNCTDGCTAVAHGVNIDVYAAPKNFRVWASLQMNKGCTTDIATTWHQYSTGGSSNDGVGGPAC